MGKRVAAAVVVLLAFEAAACDWVSEFQKKAPASEPQKKGGDAAAALEKGIEYYKAGQIDQARQWFENLVLTNPSAADGFYYLGLCHLVQAGDSPVPGSPLSPEEQASLDAFNRALSINPRHALAALGIGDLYSRHVPPPKKKPSKDPIEAHDLAVQAFQKALAIDPKLPEAQYRYARFLEKMGNFGDAEQAYKAAASAAATVPEIAPDYYTYYARFLAGRPNRALDAIEQYGLAYLFRKDDPVLQREMAALYVRIGQTYFEGRQFSLAEDTLKKGYALFPDKNAPEAQKAETMLKELRAIRR